MAELIQNNTIAATGNYSELHPIRDFVKRKALEAGLNEKRAESITLAVDEACSNLIRYGMKFNANEMIKVHANKDGSNFIIKIEDNCDPFDPRNNPSPNMNDYFKRFKKGGLGIHIMKSIVDKIEYQPATSSKTGNQLKLTMSI